jgi:hypothetical protein
MANLRLNNVTALSETGGVATFGSPSSTLKYPVGHVLQCLSAIKTDDDFSTTDNAFVDVTGLSVAITPSSSSNKILIMADVAVGSSANHSGGIRISGGNATTYVGDASSNRQRVAGVSVYMGSSTIYNIASVTKIYLDSPATTSAVTYVVQASAKINTVYINRTGDHRDTTDYDPVASSSITVMEIVV